MHEPPKPYPLRAWLREVLFCLSALVCFLAIIVTLALHDGDPLPHWPWGITINALVAVFATLFKVCMSAVVAGGE